MKKQSILRKKLAVLVGILMLGGVCFADSVQIPLQIGIFDPVPTTTGHGKSPVEIPTIWQDGYELTFQSLHPEYVLDIIQNGIIVYSTNVSKGITIVILPSWLNGEYELQLYPEDSNYYYLGYIVL